MLCTQLLHIQQRTHCRAPAAAGFLAATDDEKLSWRLCFLVPLALHIVSGLMALSGRDLPDGNFKELEMSGAKQKSDPTIVLKARRHTPNPQPQPNPQASA